MPLQQPMILVSIFIAVVTVAISQFNVPFALIVAVLLSGRLLLGPYLISRFSGVSAAAVSFRSIRGLRVARPNFQLEIDRLGFTFHLLRRQANRRIELRFEGVRLTILHAFAESSRPKRRVSPWQVVRSRFQRTTTQPAINDKPLDVSPAVEWLFGFFPDDWVRAIDAFGRRWLRYIAQTAFAFLIKAAPSLVSTISIKFASLQVVFSDLDGASISLDRASFGISLQLEVVPELKMTEEERVKLRDAKRLALSSRSWRDRMVGGMARTWESTWKGTKGTGTAFIILEKLTVSRPHCKLAKMGSDGNCTPSTFTFADIDLNAPDGAVLHIPGETRLFASCQFDPEAGGITEHSGQVGLSFSDVTIFVDILLKLMDEIKALRPPPPPQSMSSPLPSPPSSPIPSPLISSRRPTLSISSLFDTITVIKPVAPVQDFRTKFGRAEVNIPRIVLEYTSSHTRAPIRYRGQMLGFHMGVRCSDPITHLLHRKWLGRGEHRPSDTQAAWLRFDDITVNRHEDPSTDAGLVRILRSQALDIRLLLHEIPSPLTTYAPNGLEPATGFVACEATLQNFEVTETLDMLHRRLGRSPRSKPTQPPRSESKTLLRDLPRVIFSAELGEVHCRTVCDDHTFAQDVGIDFHMEKADFHLQTDFYQMKPPPKQMSKEDLKTRRQELLPLQVMTFELTAAAHAPCLRTCRALAREGHADRKGKGRADALPSPLPYARLGAPSHGRVARYDDPFLAMEGLELNVNGSLTGQFDLDNRLCLDPTSRLMDINLVADTLDAELCTVTSVEVISHFVNVLMKATLSRRHARSPSLPTAHRSPIDALPSGVAVHAAVHRVNVSATHRDLNPDCTLDVHRGVLVSTGVWVRYSSMIWDLHSHRTKWRTSQNNRRAQLGLKADVLVEALSKAAESKDPRVKSALMEVNLNHSTIKRIIGTEFGVEKSRRKVNQAALPLYAPKIRTTIAFVRDILKPNVGRRDQLQDQIHITSDLNWIHSRFELSDIYCVLLAIDTVNWALNTRLREELKKGKDVVVEVTSSPPLPPPFEVHASLNVGSIQIMAMLPLDQSITFKWGTLSASYRAPSEFQVQWQRLSGFVPSMLFLEEGRWEELGNMPGWTIGVSKNSETGKSQIHCAGDAARIRIPHSYILADLITSMAVAAKAVKQLHAITTSGSFSQMPNPPPEEAKEVPNIEVSIDTFIFEATDTPIEAKLGLAFRQGLLAQRVRLEQEDAFEAKAALVAPSENQARGIREWNFTSEHTIGVDAAKARLRTLFSNMWINQLKGARDRQYALQKAILRKFKVPDRSQEQKDFELHIYTPPLQPPILRLTMEGVNIVAQGPGFDDIGCAEFMHKRGKGLPRGTKFTLLVPLHLEISLGSASVRLRDVPLPLLNIPSHPAGGTAVSFKTDLIIGEEVGPESSVEWIDCLVSPPNQDAPGTRAFSLSIPKTTMPTKTYADPVMEFTTTEITDICWGVSFMPAMQDAVKVIETLTTMPHDPSPPVGFWDKIRLVFHWRVLARFKGGLHLHMKGSRDPWVTHGLGAGFALCFIRNVQLHIGYDNPDSELIQINSNRVLIVIPNLKHFETIHTSSLTGDDASDIESATPSTRTFQKVLAKLDGGVQVGVGFSFERSCRQDCKQCPPSASPFHRQCRIFTFKPHYQVALTAHHEQSPDWDSFKDFRSDFIHMSLSLTTATEQSAPSKRMNSVHLTPMTFTHFWHWKELFNDALALPIRQGRMWPSSRPPSEKFGRHLATLKYRIQIKNLALSHAYKQDSLENIAKGDIPVVGVKGVINSFAADFHQRDQEVQIYDSKREQMRSIRSKPMYTAEVAMDGLDLRCILAIFSEMPVEIVAHANAYESPYARIPFLASTEDSSFDLDDFVEVDWKPIEGDDPRYFVGEIVNCPTFAFFKKVEQVASPGDPGAFTKLSKFGDEPTHRCLLKHEPSPLSVQVEMVTTRIEQLKKELDAMPAANANKDKVVDLKHRISTLEAHCRRLVNAPSSGAPSQSASPSARDPWVDRGWEVYDNVYQFHTPKLTLTNSIRNVLLQYWYESRARRGFEWHMAGGAFTAIAKELQEEPVDGPTLNRPHQRQTTDDTVRTGTIKMFRPLPVKRPSRSSKPLPPESETEPDEDWQFNVNLGDGTPKNIRAEHSHYCILLKPQIVLRSELDDESVVILAANDMVLQLIDHMDTMKLPDPVKAYERTKIHMFLDGMQVFAPQKGIHEVIDKVRLPLELFVDEGCRSSDFEPIVRHTTLAVQYDRHNRLSNENLGKKDLIFVTTPRLTLQANSAAFASIYNVVSDVLLYADPSQRAHLDRLEAFMLSDNLSDLTTVREEIKLRQSRIRDLTERISTLQLRLGDQPPSQGRMELALIQGDLTKQTDELGLIFGAVQINHEKGDTKPGLWLEASSSDITWHMLDDSDHLLAKLSLKGLSLTWTSNTDGSTKNQLVIKDLQALDARPDAPFPEMLLKHRNWKDRNNKMVKADLLLRARWKTMPPVGGISILDDFKLRFHPLRIQIDASVGQKIQDYLFPKDRRNRFHSVEALSPEGRQSESPESPSPPSGSSQLAATFLKPRVLVARSASHTDLRAAAVESTPGPRLHRTRSTDALHSDHGNGFTEADKISLDHTVAEMRARSSENRTFVHANIRPSGLCLTFRRDKDMSVMVPDATELIYSTPEIEFEDRTCSFRDLASEMKWKIYQEAFNAVVKGGALKALQFTGLKEHKLFRHPKKPESSVVAASSISSIAAPSAQRRLFQKPVSRHTSRSNTPLNAGYESSAHPTRRYIPGDSWDDSTAASHGATMTSASHPSDSTIVNPMPQRGTLATFFSRNRKRSISVSGSSEESYKVQS